MLWRAALLIVASALLALLAARAVTALAARGLIYEDLDVLPARRAAVVFGPGVRSGQPTPVLYDRVATTAALYKASAVDLLLMSGDNRTPYYDEPAVMRRTAIRLGHLARFGQLQHLRHLSARRRGVQPARGGAGDPALPPRPRDLHLPGPRPGRSWVSHRSAHLSRHDLVSGARVGREPQRTGAIDR